MVVSAKTFYSNVFIKTDLLIKCATCVNIVFEATSTDELPLPEFEFVISFTPCGIFCVGTFLWILSLHVIKMFSNVKFEITFVFPKQKMIYSTGAVQMDIGAF
jgi:hypothetical protein